MAQVRFAKDEEEFGVPLKLERDIVPRFVTPHGIWPQHDLRVRFTYLEGKRKAIKEAEGLHLGLLSSRDAS
jgi:hypothetical protein